MELKFELSSEKKLELLLIIVILFAIVFASFGKMLFAAGFGFLAILVIGVIFILIAKD